MNRLQQAATLTRDMGAGWVAWRSYYEVARRSGWLKRRFPPTDLQNDFARALGVSTADLPQAVVDRWAANTARFFVDEELSVYREWIADPEAVVQEAEAIVQGHIGVFGTGVVDIGRPASWVDNPASGTRYPDGEHWTNIPSLSPELGDIKYVWEPARATYTFTLVRAFAASGKQVYADAFWELFDEWDAANRPEMGPHWMCAQEMSLRCLAWMFGLHAFGDNGACNPDRLVRMIGQLRHHGRHIERFHWYARKCLRNDHAVCEGVGLFSLGVLLPFLGEAERWRGIGLQTVVQECDRQVYDDGSYIQHSNNYARAVAQLLSWAFAIAHANDVALPESLSERARRLSEFLLAMQDSVSGRVPNYGSSDGALIFPLSSCDHTDFRSAVAALLAGLGEASPYRAGAWDEETAWFCGPDFVAKARRKDASPPVARQPSATRFDSGGYYVLRGPRVHGVIRCTDYRHRPFQADMLHLDVWYNGFNVLIDPGTYQYNVEDRWKRYFAGTESHNTVSVDGCDQMTMGPRFLCFDWTRGQLNDFDDQAGSRVFDGEHSGYQPVIHRRRVTLANDVFLVEDWLSGDTATHCFRLHWLANDFAVDPHEDGARITLPDGLKLRLAVRAAAPWSGGWSRGEEERARGWQSSHYGERVPASSFACMVEGDSAEFVTLVGPEAHVESLATLELAAIRDAFRATES